MSSGYRSRYCLPGALMSSAMLYAAQGASVILLVLTRPPGGLASTMALVALGVAEVAAASLAAASRAGLPLGVAASWILVLAGPGALSYPGPRILDAALAVVAAVLAALGWPCVSERPPASPGAGGASPEGGS